MTELMLSIFCGAYQGVIGSLLFTYFHNKVRGKIISDDHDEVKPGFVSPKNLEVRCKDFDGCGKKETVLTIDGEKYELRYDSFGPGKSAPILSPLEKTKTTRF